MDENTLRTDEDESSEYAAQGQPAGAGSLVRPASKVKPKHPMEAILKGVAGNAFPKIGEIVEGAVLEKRGPRLFVDLGARGMGIVYGREYYIAQDIIKGLKPGTPVSAKVVEIDNDEGYIELSLKEAGEERRWVDLKEMMKTGKPVDLAVMEANRGGLILELKGVKGFLPASQLSSKHYPRVDGGDKEKISQELQKLVGETIQVKILDVNPEEEKLIFTEKELDQESLRVALDRYHVGDTVEGEITGVVDFGAFMKFDDAGLEGLIHISEIDWTLIEDPRQILKVGESVKAKIIDIQGEKIALSLKALKEDPWTKIAERYHKGDTVTGTVTKFNPFGAFVQLDENFHGLVHISEFGTEVKMRETLEVGKQYPFVILLIDPKEHRMPLGIPGGKGVEEARGTEQKADSPQ